MRKLILVPLLISGMAAAAVAQEVGVSQDEVLIGSCADLVGNNRSRSTQLLEGARAYFDHVNAEGGVYGRKLKLTSSDDSGDLKQAVACFKKLQDQGVFGGAFFIGSPPASRYAPMAEYNRIPVVGFVSGAHFLYEPVKHYVFPVHPSHRDLVAAAINGGWKELDLRKIASVQEENATGKSVAEAVSFTLAKKGLTPCESQTLSSIEHDEVKAAIDRLKAAGAQMVFIALPSAASIDLIRTSRQSGWSPLFVLVNNDPTVLQTGGKDLDGVIVLQPFPGPDRGDLETIALYNRFLKKYVRHAVPSYIGVEGFVGAMVLVEGLKRAGRSLTRDKFIDALESLQNFDVGLGPEYKMSFSGESHDGSSASSATVIRDSKEFPLDWSLLKSNRASLH